MSWPGGPAAGTQRRGKGWRSRPRPGSLRAQPRSLCGLNSMCVYTCVSVHMTACSCEHSGVCLFHSRHRCPVCPGRPWPASPHPDLEQSPGNCVLGASSVPSPGLEAKELSDCPPPPRLGQSWLMGAGTHLGREGPLHTSRSVPQCCDTQASPWHAPESATWSSSG